MTGNHATHAYTHKYTHMLTQTQTHTGAFYLIMHTNTLRDTCTSYGSAAAFIRVCSLC